MAEQWTVKSADSNEVAEVQSAEVPQEEVQEVPQEEVQEETPAIEEGIVPQEEEVPSEEETPLESTQNEQETENNPEVEEEESPITVLGEEEVANEQPPVSREGQPRQKNDVIMPEEVQKLISFMEDNPGSTVEDYTKLNKDINSFSDDALLREYYQDTQPDLTGDEIDFLINDEFGIDEDVDEESDVKRKTISHKKALRQAKTHLESKKNKYYDEIKARGKFHDSDNVQEALEFKQSYDQNQERTQQVVEQFQQETDKVFHKDFKSFDFTAGDFKFKYNVKNAQKIKEQQLDLGNFVNKFIDDNGNVADASGYHKAIYVANNYERMFKEIYEQGKAAAIKAKAKEAGNISMGAKSKSAPVSGASVKQVGNDGASNFGGGRIKLKQY